jgi:hypothetical protein
MLDRLWQAFYWMYVRRVVCQHFCTFKAGGSTMRYTHVHFLFKGGPGAKNPGGYTGVGHDDETAADDPKHNTVSQGKTVGFKMKGDFPVPWGQPPPPGPPSATIYPSDLDAWNAFDAYFINAPPAGESFPPGFWRLRCDCGDACVTMDHATWERWYRQQSIQPPEEPAEPSSEAPAAEPPPPLSFGHPHAGRLKAIRDWLRWILRG